MKKARDLVVGFVGWFYFANLVFILVYFLGISTRFLPYLFAGYATYNVNFPNLLFWLAIFLWLPTIAFLYYVFAKQKEGWIGAGILAAIIVNAGANFISRGSSLDLLTLGVCFVPFPLVLLLYVG